MPPRASSSAWNSSASRSPPSRSQCAQAHLHHGQQNLHNLLMNRPVYYIDEKGERVYLDDAAHKAEIERQRQLIRENCNND